MVTDKKINKFTISKYTDTRSSHHTTRFKTNVNSTSQLLSIYHIVFFEFLAGPYR